MGYSTCRFLHISVIFRMERLHRVTNSIWMENMFPRSSFKVRRKFLTVLVILIGKVRNLDYGNVLDVIIFCIHSLFLIKATRRISMHAFFYQTLINFYQLTLYLESIMTSSFNLRSMHYKKNEMVSTNNNFWLLTQRSKFG